MIYYKKLSYLATSLSVNGLLSSPKLKIDLSQVPAFLDVVLNGPFVITKSLSWLLQQFSMFNT